MGIVLFMLLSIAARLTAPPVVQSAVNLDPGTSGTPYPPHLPPTVLRLRANKGSLRVVAEAVELFSHLCALEEARHNHHWEALWLTPKP